VRGGGAMTITTGRHHALDHILRRQAEHRRDYLVSQKGILVLAGATQTDDGKEAIGSLFVVNVGSRAEAKKFSDGDPFTQNGVFASITITRMRKGQWTRGQRKAPECRCSLLGPAGPF
jgi:uncharacterized protein